MAKTPHLEDLFRKGTVVTITDSDDVEYRILVRRPGPNQHDAVLEAANGKMAKYTIQYEKKEGSSYEALSALVLGYEHDQLLDERLKYVESELREQAFNEVMYDEKIGSRWSRGDDEDESVIVYVDILTAITDRWAEITRFNDEVEADDRIQIEDDEELNRLNEVQEKFQGEVDERAEELMAVERARHANKPDAQLRNEIVKSGIEVEGKLHWYQEYQVRLLYYACRDSENEDDLYFSDPYSILELPTYIKDKLYAAYQELETGSEQLKNSLSLPISSA